MEEKRKTSDLYERASALYSEEKYDEARAIAEQGMQLGDADCENLMGCLYNLGLGVNRDNKKAFEYFLSAANKGQLAAQCNVGVYYYSGKSGKTDYEKAHEWYKKAADGGSPRGNYLLGKLYYSQQNYEKAREYFLLASDGGNIHAMLSVANIYRYGRGVEKDFEKSMEFCRKAADSGNAEAMTKIAEAYENGIGVEQDHDAAIEWYIKAQKKGNKAARLALERSAAWSFGREVASVVEWVKKVAAHGYPKGIRNLAECYELGKGVEKDFCKALELYEMAAEKGEQDSVHMLKKVLKSGMDEQKEVREYEALAAYQREYAKRGNADMQYLTGRRYAYGITFERDEKEAIKWYKMAVQGGSERALYNLGWCYEYGAGVEIDKERAIDCWKRAAALGEERAKASLELRGIKP